MPHKLSSKMASADDTATDSLDDIPQSISISFLPNHSTLSDRILRKGLNYFSHSYIQNIKLYTKSKPHVRVVSSCWRSMRKSEKPHTQQIEINFDKISESYCTCKVGLNGHCSHVIGLVKSLQGFKLHNIKRVPNQMSCTSMPQQWHVPRGKKICPVPINHVVVARSCEARKRKPVLCQINLLEKLPKVTTADIEQLKCATGTPFEYLLSPKAPTVTTPLGETQLGSFLSYQTRNLKQFTPALYDGCGHLTINRTAPVKLPEKYTPLRQRYTVKDPENIEKSTRMQSESAEWHSARKNRLTASNFGLILKRKSPPTDKMLSRRFSAKTVHAASLSYGKRNESKAQSKYLTKFPDRHLQYCGFVVNNEFPFLGATPDGKLCDKGEVGIIEVKCPYSARDLTISQACSQIQNFFLHEDQSGTISLRENHEHYAQVQGQLMVTGCSYCDFIVFCPNESDLFVQRILPNKIFMENMLNVLGNFFEKYALPYFTASLQ